jgi:mannose-6-phosphate isomerase-like protein (cupin superfamily)
MKRFFVIAVVILISKSYAQNDSSRFASDEGLLLAKSQAIRICSDSLKWNDAKAPLPPGAKVAIIEGNPKEEGHFTIRIKMPPNYIIAPHVHPVDERATVLSGAMYIGMGDTLDKKNAQKISAGCFYLNPAGMHHYAFTGKEETILQISTNGPWGLHYIETLK